MATMGASDKPSSVSAGPSALAAVIAKAVADAGGWIGFDRFMALALYEPGLGYYNRGAPVFGAMPSSGSDFVTAPEMSPLFGATLARPVAEALAAAAADTVLEFGAGSGALAAQLLDALDALGQPVRRYAIVELSGALRQRQQATLARFGDRVAWLDTWPEAIEGVVVGNEVLDAMPVTLLHFDGQGWFERGVAVEQGRFVWADRPTARQPPHPGPFVPGTTTEIHPQAEAFVRGLAARLRRGAAFFIDYGFPEAEYYHPQRQGGTLMCHRAHRADADPLADVGEKDITAHVNFSAVALAAQDAGLDVLGYTSQARFLYNAGIAGLLAEAGLVQRTHAARLVNEHEMGELFKVLMLGRGLETAAFAAGAPLGFSDGDRCHRL
jgi:SAM-dependent MidA family methyltransferase